MNKKLISIFTSFYLLLFISTHFLILLRRVLIISFIPTSIPTSTSIRSVINYKKTISRETNNNIVLNPTVPKNNNNTKYDFTGTSIKNQLDEKL